MRVIAGQAKGMKIKGSESSRVRPTGDRVKEALFNMLGYPLTGETMLDLFAGFGGIGIEALSRGAERVVLVEKGEENLKLIAENLKKASLREGAELLSLELPGELKLLKGRNFSLIFLDPPYYRGLLVPTLQEIRDLRLLERRGVVIAEHQAGLQPEDGLEGYQLLDRRCYGSEELSFLRY